METLYPSDGELVLLVIAKDPAGLEELKARYGKKVRQVIRSRTGNLDSLSDIESLVWISVWTKPERFNPEFEFGNWISRVAVNKTIDWMRKEKRDGEGKSRLEEESASFQVESQLEREERDLVEEVRRSLDRLSPKSKELALAFMKAGTIRSAAASLGIPWGTAATRWAKLKREWKF